ncbi:MAG: hypothetical protein COA33_012680 [Fluviicola sp.]|nr:hypothetical protein [Fluviicola sp.]
MLTLEELEVFEEDFKQFLIVNGVHAEEWEEMNRSDKEKAVQLVEVFSDSVLQKVYEKIQFLEHRSESSCLVFKLNKENIELISINKKEKSKVNLATPESIHKALQKNAKDIRIFKTQKKYTKIREKEIHELIQQGCLQSSELFWGFLLEILPENTPS